MAPKGCGEAVTSELPWRAQLPLSRGPAGAGPSAPTRYALEAGSAIPPYKIATTFLERALAVWAC